MPARATFVTVALLAFATLLPCGFAEPRDDWNLAARLPEGAVAFAGFEQLDHLQARLEATALGRMGKDPALKGFVEPLARSIQDMAGPDVVPPFVKDLLEHLAHLRGQLALGFLGMSPSDGEPQLVASLDFGPHVGDFAQFLQRLLAEVGGDDVKVQIGEQGGRPVWTVAIRRGPTLAATTHDTTFVVATNPGLLMDVVGGAPPRSLAASADFQAVGKRLGGDGLAFHLYANVPAALEAFAGGWDGPERQMADAFGLDTVKAVAYGVSFSGDGFRDSLVLHTPGADHGLMSMFSMPVLDRPRTLDLAPANAFLCGEGNFDVSQLLPGMRKLMALVEPDAAAEMDEGLAEFSKQLGVDLEKELLGGLAGTFGMYAGLPQGGGLYPELALTLTVKDPAAYEQVLVRLWEGVAGFVNEDGDVIMCPRVLEVDGQRLHLIELQYARGDDVLPFTPSWTLLGDRLVLTLVPYTLREVVWRAKNPTEAGAGIQGQEDFRALWATKAPSAGSFGYLDLQAIASFVYDTAVPLLQTAVKPNVLEKAGLPFTPDWALLPPARQVRKYFRSVAWTESLQRDGYELHLHSPVPMLPLVGVAAAGALFGMRTARRPDFPRPDVIVQPEPPRRMPAQAGAEARATVEELARYVKLYVLERGEMPSSLEDLVKAGMLDQVPEDPWGRPYALLVKDAAQRDFRVASAGADGDLDTGDDVASGGR